VGEKKAALREKLVSRLEAPDGDRERGSRPIRKGLDDGGKVALPLSAQGKFDEMFAFSLGISIEGEGVENRRSSC